MNIAPASNSSRVLVNSNTFFIFVMVLIVYNYNGEKRNPGIPLTSFTLLVGYNEMT